MSAGPRTTETLGPAHIADLRGVAANPRFVLIPRRRQLYKQLRLITAAEPPRAPRSPTSRLCKVPPRAHALTDAGRLVLAREELLSRIYDLEGGLHDALNRWSADYMDALDDEHFRRLRKLAATRVLP